MAIKTNELNQPERGMVLGNREAGNGDSAVLQAMRERIATAKQAATIKLKQKKEFPHTTPCPDWEKGWLAAIAEIEAGTPT
jgi:chorismate mutase